MDSALSPREIQARIRGGESLEAVAEAAGVPADTLEPFAAPVIAEREHVLGQALSCPVRRKGESSSARALRHVVAEGLHLSGLDEADLVWDAWRDPERNWVIVGRHSEGDETREARFRFDLRGRFSVARDDWARALIGEPRPGVAQAPRPLDPDNEPTVDLDDAVTPQSQPEFPARPIPRQPIEQLRVDDEPELSLEDAQDDLVGHASQLDVLYDMLSSFDEDSVNVYADLSRPVTDDRDDDLIDQVFQDEQPALDESAQEPSVNLSELELEDTNPVEREPLVRKPEARKPTPKPAAPPPAPTEPEQDALLTVEEPAAKPKPRSRRTRASIPSWDEIVFGGPKPDEGSKPRPPA